MHKVSSYFNIEHAFDIFESYPGYIDVFCFASSINSYDMPNVYFNNIDTLDKFILNFKDQISNITKEISNQRMFIPGHLRLNFDSTIITTQRNTNRELILLSKRETDVLRVIVRGRTIKETAKILGLSHRTVERYLENIKVKTNTTSKYNLIDKMIDQFQK